MKISFFKRYKYKQFHYEPRYYDPVKEELESRISMIKREIEKPSTNNGEHYDSELLRQRFRSTFRRQHNTSKNASMLRIVIVFVLLTLAYLLLK
ncbi:hypothetical protein AAG747_20625 [Rapidithrix thailandica]|uniref:Uncharacterized protein n=1 Tax=Rapidithrix thailandica TaxID=413964 RepID=A0AAW9SBJ8_9BACT